MRNEIERNRVKSSVLYKSYTCINFAATQAMDQSTDQRISNTKIRLSGPQRALRKGDALKY